MTAANGTLPGIHLYGNHSSRPAATAVSAGAIYFCSTHGLVYESDGSTWTTVFNPGSAIGQTFAIEFVIDGGGSAISTGIKGYLYLPFAGTITGVVLLADVSGSVVVDIFKSTYTAYDPTTHPASADKITASTPPTISSAKKSKDTTLTGWTTTFSADDVLAFNVNSASTVTKVTISLQGTRS